MSECNYLRISIIDRCNFRCVYCMPPHGLPRLNRDALLTYDEICEVVEAGVRCGIRKVRLTGGEPLIRRNVMHLVARLAQMAGVSELALTTNGALLGQYASELARAGVASINISLDSLRPERFARITRRNGQLASVLNGIDAALRAGIPTVKINTVVMRGVNDDELLDFVQLALRQPLTVRFIELMDVGSGTAEANFDFVPVSEMIGRIESQHSLESIPGGWLAGPAVDFSVDHGAGTIGFISGVSAPFCASCNRLRLTSLGNLLPCLAGTAGVPLMPVLRSPHTQDDLVCAFDEAVQMKATCGGGCYRAMSAAMSQIGG